LGPGAALGGQLRWRKGVKQCGDRLGAWRQTLRWSLCTWAFRRLAVAEMLQLFEGGDGSESLREKDGTRAMIQKNVSLMRLSDSDAAGKVSAPNREGVGDAGTRWLWALCATRWIWPNCRRLAACRVGRPLACGRYGLSAQW